MGLDGFSDALDFFIFFLHDLSKGSFGITVQRQYCAIIETGMTSDI